ncbi:blood vessel epicardial substance-like [Panonychus citri]|uniref:blood vessel epicardial substance-like n=1 Tax=Panonychus citri TaxID=50023 RepID=UPI002308294B|nr:blood vessel epicardial substance-like [Panonychus citri]
MDNWLFHLANCFLAFGYIDIPLENGLLISRCSSTIGLIILCDWSVKVICSPLVFTWSVVMLIVNIGHTIHLFYTFRQVNFSSKSLERVYNRMFAPMGVNKLTFQRLSCPDNATIHRLEAGEAYSIQNLTKNDRLSLLISGRANVICNGNYLHPIEPLEFMDSPEFESNCHNSNEDKMNVSIIAAVPCRYISWERSNLEYHLIKETAFSYALSYLIARDITEKLFTMNKKVRSTH